MKEAEGRSDESWETLPTQEARSDAEVMAEFRAHLNAEKSSDAGASLSEFKERGNERQHNIDRLIDYYGDQKFNYGKYHGTIIDMINLCPPIQGLLDREDGFETIVAWIDPYKVSETTEETVNEEKPETKETDKKVDSGTKPAKAEVSKPSKAVEPKETKSDSPTEKPKATVNLPKKRSKATKANESQTVKPKQPTVLEKSTVNKIGIAPAGEDITKSESPAKPEEARPVEITAEPPQSIKAAEPKELEAAPISINPAIETEASRPALPEKPKSAEPITLPHSEIFEAWRELGEQQTPLETLFTTMVDQLAAPSLDTDVLADAETDNLELSIVLARVQTTRQAFEKLYLPSTPQEHAEQITLAIGELSQLLRLMGYENPSDIIRQFLEHHPPQALHDLLEYLETVLGQSVERVQPAMQTAKRAPHLTLGNLVMRVLEIFAPGLDVSAG